jgi:hypothetical protein
MILGMFLGRRYLVNEIVEKETENAEGTRTISTAALRETNDAM